MNGAQLKKLRRELGMTQAYMGNVFGVTDAAVTRWETGARPVPEHVAVSMIAEVTGARALALLDTGKATDAIPSELAKPIEERTPRELMELMTTDAAALAYLTAIWRGWVL